MQINLIGQKFDHLTVIGCLGRDPSTRNKLWECKCSCGNMTSANTRQLREHKKRDCGCMKKVRIDLTGMQFGYLTAEFPLGKNDSGQMVWHCSCNCGRPDCKGELDVESRRLKLGWAMDCCYQDKEAVRPRVDYTGRRFGLLTVIEPTERMSASHNRIYFCRCDCGNIIELPDNQLISGNNRSCGCMKKRLQKQEEGN